jgi:SulP family sulfate permease
MSDAVQAPGRPARFGAADLLAGLSIAGLLVPEAVAYAGLAGMPPQAGVMALLAGLLVYGLMGSSRFAIVSATSSSAAVLLAAITSVTGVAAGARPVLAAGLVLLAGLCFIGAALARLGAISSLVAKPVLRGFSLGLALTIVVKQCPAILGVQPAHSDFFRLLADLAAALPRWNWGCAAIGVAALVLLRLLALQRWLPGAVLVIALGIALDVGGIGPRWGVPAVGAIQLHFDGLQWPALGRADWLRLGELAVALALILYAESYGSIRTFAIRHGDAVSPNRDLLALGVANLLAGLLQGMPVGAGYSATSANEAAGARSRAAGLAACAIVAGVVATLLPWIAHTPEPVLAAIVIHAVGHTLNPAALRPYFRWRRDRLVSLIAFAAVLLLGVLDGLLAAIAASLLMLLRSLAQAHVSWLGRLADGHDFVDLARHPEAVVPPGWLIARPDVPLFFGNADALLGAVRARVLTAPQLQRVVLSLEESSDLDATSIEALCEFTAWTHARGLALSLARVKDQVRDLLARVDAPELPAASYAAWSVDDAVRPD